MSFIIIKVGKWLLRVPEKGYLILTRLVEKIIRWCRKTIPLFDRISANALTSVRFFVTAALVIIILKTDWRIHLRWIISANLLAYATDLADGPLARITDKKTKLGSWLDNVGDKALLAPNLWIIYFLTHESFRLMKPLLWAIVGFDLTLILLRVVSWRLKIHVEANSFGKAKILLQFLGVLLIEINTLDFPNYGVFLLRCSLGFSFLSLGAHIILNAPAILGALITKLSKRVQLP